MIKQWRLDFMWTSQWQFGKKKNYETSLNIFLINSFRQMQCFPYSTEPLALSGFFFFPKLKIHLKSKRFENMEKIKRNKTSQFQNHIKKGVSEVLYKTGRNKYWMPRRLFWRKLTFYSSFISVILNTALVVILFEHNKKLMAKKKKISKFQQKCMSKSIKLKPSFLLLTVCT